MLSAAVALPMQDGLNVSPAQKIFERPTNIITSIPDPPAASSSSGSKNKNKNTKIHAPIL
jgi:hypothetical protein